MCRAHKWTSSAGEARLTEIAGAFVADKTHYMQDEVVACSIRHDELAAALLLRYARASGGWRLLDSMRIGAAGGSEASPDARLNRYLV